MPFDKYAQFSNQLAGVGKWRDHNNSLRAPGNYATQRSALLNYFIDNLEDWFAVIGITEEFDISLQAFEKVYKLPFAKLYQGAKNTGKMKKKVEKSQLEALKRELETSPVAMEALHEDLMLYAKAREIFEQQKASLL